MTVNIRVGGQTSVAFHFVTHFVKLGLQTGCLCVLGPVPVVTI
jgi:hypothetical protein